MNTHPAVRQPVVEQHRYPRSLHHPMGFSAQEFFTGIFYALIIITATYTVLTCGVAWISYATSGSDNHFDPRMLFWVPIIFYYVFGITGMTLGWLGIPFGYGLALLLRGVKSLAVRVTLFFSLGSLIGATPVAVWGLSMTMQLSVPRQYSSTLPTIHGPLVMPEPPDFWESFSFYIPHMLILGFLSGILVSISWMVTVFRIRKRDRQRGYLVHTYPEPIRQPKYRTRIQPTFRDGRENNDY